MRKLGKVSEEALKAFKDSVVPLCKHTLSRRTNLSVSQCKDIVYTLVDRKMIRKSDEKPACWHGRKHASYEYVRSAEGRDSGKDEVIDLTRALAETRKANSVLFKRITVLEGNLSDALSQLKKDKTPEVKGKAQTESEEDYSLDKMWSSMGPALMEQLQEARKSLDVVVPLVRPDSWCEACLELHNLRENMKKLKGGVECPCCKVKLEINIEDDFFAKLEITGSAAAKKKS